MTKIDIKDVKNNPSIIVSSVCKYMLKELEYMDEECIEGNIREAFNTYFELKGYYKRVIVYHDGVEENTYRCIKEIPLRLKKTLDWFNHVTGNNAMHTACLKDRLIDYCYESVLASEDMPSKLNR